MRPRAGLDLRTGPGVFKRVMWYHHGVGYGNDVMRRAPDPWDDRAMGAYVDFIKPLIAE